MFKYKLPWIGHRNRKANNNTKATNKTIQINFFFTALFLTINHYFGHLKQGMVPCFTLFSYFSYALSLR